MGSIKTAISLQETLFEQVEVLAEELNISRSRVFALAVEAFIQRHQNQRMLDQINQAYDDLPDPAEQDLLRKQRAVQRQIVEAEW